MAAAHVPAEISSATKLAAQMIERAITAGVPFSRPRLFDCAYPELADLNGERITTQAGFGCAAC